MFYLKEVDVDQPDLYLRPSDVLYVVISGLALGGAERIVLDWAIRVYPKWKVHIVVLRDHKQEWSVPNFIGTTRLHNKDIKKNLTLVAKKIARSKIPVCLCHLLSQKERDILLSQGVVAVPVLHNAKNGWIENSECLEKSPYVISVSKNCANDLFESGYHNYSSIIRHIPNARKFSEGIREKYRKEWRVPVEAFVVGMIGAVKPQKNYTFALKILKAMLLEKNAYLVILGGPIGRNGQAEWKKILLEIEHLGIRNRVAMPGFVPDAIKCLPAFDVVLNTSHYEGLSIATLECLVNKVPVVASHVGGQGEIMHEGLKLVRHDAPEEVWVSSIKQCSNMLISKPSWSGFPSFRLWTLAQLAKPIEENKKVLFITANLNSGGAQRSLVNLLTSSREFRKYEVAVTGNSTAPYFFNKLKKFGLKVFRSTDSRDAFDHAEVIVQKVSSENIGTLCFWNLDPKIKLLLVKTLCFTKIRFIDVSPGDYSFEEMEEIKSFQDLICFDQEEYNKRLNKVVLKYDSEVFCNDLEKRVIIPNGIPDVGFVKTNYSISDNPKIVVNGRIAPTKFLAEIIEAVKIVWNKFPATELHIYGAVEPRHQDYVKDLQHLAGSDNRIFFHGLNFEVVSKLADYDVAVVLGKNQGCPNSLLEALSVGLPSIANDDGGTAEQLIHNQTGLLIKSCEPFEIACAIEKILQDREFAKNIGHAGRKHVMNNFSMKSMRLEYLNLFKKGRKGIGLNFCSLDKVVVYLKNIFYGKKGGNLAGEECAVG
jgi:glycosyltransferase involved in cell wall biosynthesis